MSKRMDSLVCTVRDEADNIAALIDSMLQQTQPADEIVINDCGSRDSTCAIVQGYIARGYPIRLVCGGHNIPSGRNNAIRHAHFELIACTDAGLILDPCWLERIVAPLVRDEADVVGGFFRPDPRSIFELALGATNYRDVTEIDPTTFIPFGKSCAFRRSAWQQAGGYPEWASHCEDVLFALMLRRLGKRFAFVGDALVAFRPRPTPAAFMRQYLLYARGDGVAGLWRRRHMIRYAAYGVGGMLLVLGMHRPIAWLGLAAGGWAYVRAPWRRLWRRARGYPVRDQVAAAALVPAIRLIGDLAKMIGYPIGILRRHALAGLAADVARYWQRMAEQREK
ncbi:MAG TPA: glycosyltransferase [Roseiflexaceae bacterium]|nr:glycosyltransferase [Roseiflexaceae bacterium]